MGQMDLTHVLRDKISAPSVVGLILVLIITKSLKDALILVKPELIQSLKISQKI